MGANLILSHAWILKDRQPNLRRGVAHLEELAKKPLYEWPTAWPGLMAADYEDRAVAVKQLYDDYDAFVAGINSHRRDVSWIDVGPYTIYLTGGMSWGDPPTDATEIFDRLTAAGVLDAMGFFKGRKHWDP